MADVAAAAAAAAANDLKIPSSASGANGEQAAPAASVAAAAVGEITYAAFASELQLPTITALIAADLSEPYSVYTYRYFLHSWPHLSFLAMDGEKCVGTIVCKLEQHKTKTYLNPPPRPQCGCVVWHMPCVRVWRVGAARTGGWRERTRERERRVTSFCYFYCVFLSLTPPSFSLPIELR